MSHPLVTAPVGTRAYYAQLARAARLVSREAEAAARGRIALARPDVPLLERIRARVDIRGPDDCWDWLGVRDEDGYGRFTYGDRCYRPHRVMWEAENGPMPEELFGAHSCDRPPCCNPRHVFPATPAENTADSLAKGRHSSLNQTGRVRGPYRRPA